MRTRKISKYSPPIENIVIWGKGFTEEECDKIIEESELQEFNFSRGEIGNGDIDTEIRNSDIFWLQPNENNNWIFDRMNEILAKVNFDKFQMDLITFDGFQYTKYDVDSHYNWHVDTQKEREDGHYRKLSLSLMLSNQDEFEGGEFIFNENGDQEKAKGIKLNKGDLVIFYSTIPHKVCPVTKGQRLTLVTWALGPKIV
jgi:PKHD-type hydroxylase